jgi:EmrB/QacA subfamily drug resistance transporter
VRDTIDAVDYGVIQATPAQRTETKTRQGLALGVLSGALALDIGGQNGMNAALPAIATRFDLGDATLQWTMIGYAVTFAGFLLFGGRAADVLGRRRVFSAGIALFALAAAAGAVAPDVRVLLVARAVQGAGAALSVPAALALLTEVFPPGPARNRALSFYAAVGAASGSAGFVLGGLLTDWLGWRSVLFFFAVLGVAALAAGRASLPAGVRTPQRLDLPGAALVTAGLLSAVFGVSRGAQVGWTDPVAAVALAVAVVALATFVGWERRAPQPLLPLSIFRAAPVRAGALTAFLLFTAALGLQFFAPLYMQETVGYSPATSGLAILPLSLAVFLTANFLASRWLTGLGQRPLMVGGLLLIGIGVGAWAWTPTDGVYWLHMLPGLVIAGVGAGFAFPAMTAAALTAVPQERHGVAGAVNVTAQQVGASVGVAVLVAVAAAADGNDHPAYVTAALLCVGGALFIALNRGRNPSVDA